MSDDGGLSSAELHQAVGQLSDHIRKPYLAAVETCPTLVQSESTPVRFYEAADRGLDAAAARLATWWKLRTDYFGSRAHKPMTISTDGAMTRQDLEVFESGFFVKLPSDRQGRTVLFYDREQLTRDFDNLEQLAPSMIRCVIYLITAVAQEVPITASTVLLYHCSQHFSVSPVDQEFLNGLSTSLGNAPLIFEGTELTFLTPRSQRQDYLSSIIPQVTSTVKRLFGDHKVSVIVSNTKPQLKETLQMKGLDGQGIPPAVGGRYRCVF